MCPACNSAFTQLHGYQQASKIAHTYTHSLTFTCSMHAHLQWYTRTLMHEVKETLSSRTVESNKKQKKALTHQSTLIHTSKHDMWEGEEESRGEKVNDRLKLKRQPGKWLKSFRIRAKVQTQYSALNRRHTKMIHLYNLIADSLYPIHSFLLLFISFVIHPERSLVDSYCWDFKDQGCYIFHQLWQTTMCRYSQVNLWTNLNFCCVDPLIQID